MTRGVMESVMRAGFAVCAAFLMMSCVTSELDQQASASATATDMVWSLDNSISELRKTSCPEEAAFKAASSIDIKVEEIGRGVAAEDSFSGLSFAGAWHLSSTHKRFGGLSGLEVLRSGSLLSVSDDGRWVWIGIDPETMAPDGIGSIANMLDERGKVVWSKPDKDSEGLAFRDGLAIVSFEHDHRISAFDLEGCGAAARAAPIIKLPDVVAGKRVPKNRGGEALALLEDGTLRVGFELVNENGAAVGRVRRDDKLDKVSFESLPFLYLMTGLDVEGVLTAKLLRSYDPIRGPRAIVRVSRDGEEIASANFKGALPVDNFEGVAIGKGPGGKTRIWMVSDDNFKRGQQRTLLFALDLDT